MVSDAESVAGIQELGESDEIDDDEVEPQDDGPEDLEVKMDEPHTGLEEQEDVEKPQGGFMFGGVHWNAGRSIIGINLMIGTSLKTL